MKDILVDNYNRKIDYLRLSVTDRCNLRCIYCMPESGVRLLPKDELLTFEEISKIVRILSELGIKKIKITGGEPLLRENILTLIDKIYKIKKIKDISFTTNGILVGSYLKDLYDIGIRRINVSLDSMDDKKFKIITRGGNLKKVLGSIFGALKMGFSPVKINTVITPLLDGKDILELIKLTIDNPVSIRFIEMMEIKGIENKSSTEIEGIECGRIGMIKEDKRAYFSSINQNSFLKGSDDIFSIMRDFGEYQRVDGPLGYGPAVYYKFKRGKGTIGFILNNDSYCKSCSRIRLTSDGIIRLCLFSKNGLDIKSMIRKNFSADYIKFKVIDFINRKPESRKKAGFELEECSNFKISYYMSQLGG